MSTITQVGGTATANLVPGSGSDGDTLTISAPAGVAARDVLLAHITTNNRTVTAPSGWVNFGGGTSAGFAWQAQLYYKIAGSSEPADYDWTIGSGTDAPSAGCINAWRGVDNGDPIGAIAEVFDDSDLSEPSTTPSVTVPSDCPRGRLYAVRACRRAAADGVVFSESDASWSRRTTVAGLGGVSYTVSHFSHDTSPSFTTSGSKTGLAISGSLTETNNYKATYALREENQGTSAMTLGSVTMDVEADHRISGDVDLTLGNVTADFAGEGSPPTGDVAMTLSPVSADFAADSDIGGDSDLQLSPVVAGFSGAVEPIGDIDLQLPSVTVQFGTETQPFGEHVIRVEEEKRSFLVIQDDPGLIPIYVGEVNFPIDYADFGLTLQPITMDFAGALIHGDLSMTLPSIGMAVDAKKVNIVYAVDIGNGSLTSFTVTHNLGSKDVLTAVYETASPYEEVQPTSIERTTTNTITVTFPVAPTTSQYRVVVVYG